MEDVKYRRASGDKATRKNDNESRDRRPSTDDQKLDLKLKEQRSFDEPGTEYMGDVYKVLLSRVSGLENVYGYMFNYFSKSIEEIQTIRDQFGETKEREGERPQQEESDDSDATVNADPDLNIRICALEKMINRLYGEVKSYVGGVQTLQSYTILQDDKIRKCHRVIHDAREQMFTEMGYRAQEFRDHLREIWQSELTNERTAHWAKHVDAIRAKEAAERRAERIGDQFNVQNYKMSYLVGEVSDVVCDIKQHRERSVARICHRLEEILDKYGN